MNEQQKTSFKCDFDKCRYWQNIDKTQCRARRNKWRKCPYRYYRARTLEFEALSNDVNDFWEALEDFSKVLNPEKIKQKTAIEKVKDFLCRFLKKQSQTTKTQEEKSS